MQGTVTLDGEPLPSGAIQLVSTAGSSVPVAGAEIKEGKFLISAKRGLKPGVFRVEITSAQETGKQMKLAPGVPPAPEFKNIIPARYNKKSELTATITAGGTTDLPFALTSK